MARVGLEPTRLAAQASKTCVAASYTTGPAFGSLPDTRPAVSDGHYDGAGCAARPVPRVNRACLNRGFGYIFTLSAADPTRIGARTLPGLPAGRGRMRFNLVDRVHEWEPGKRLTATKVLTLGEEYLADHFPSFPVMPGVLMLQAVTEASAWLWRVTTEFKHSVIVLREVKNVKYGTFMQPGHTLELSTEMVKADESTATFRGKGNVQGGGQTVNAQIMLAGYNVKDRLPDGAATDEKLRLYWKERWNWLCGPPKRA
jgi:3-hydroxyacyl-[acyl-carrier-protein] dehydratase